MSHHVPSFRIFLSSTAVDLVEYREKASDAVLRLNQFPVDMKTFGARPGDSVEVCRRLAAEADAVIVIVAHRYGWVPTADEGGDGKKSITWIEVEAAHGAKKPVFAFLVDPEAPWDRSKEQDRLTTATTHGQIMEVAAAVQSLQDFKMFLQKGVRDTFTNADDLEAKVATSLANWLNERIIERLSGRQPAPRAPARNWQARVVHPPQPALHFQGRASLLTQMQAWWDDPASRDRIIALVAAGGTGKTALSERVLSYVERKPRAAGVFVWSFYEEPKIETFLRVACDYFEVARNDDPGGLGQWLQLALGDGAHHLLLLDGLERVQSVGGDGRVRGELEDHTLKLLLRSIARGLGRARALITSRFDLIDLYGWNKNGYLGISLDDLDPPSACTLLRAWGVTKGTDADLDQVARRVGYHALSISVLGSYLVNFGDGDPANAPNFDIDAQAEDDLGAARLASVLKYYSEKLTKPERDLLGRLSIFASGVNIELLRTVIDAGGVVAGSLSGLDDVKIGVLLKRLKDRGLVFSYDEGGALRYSAHPFLRDYFRKLLEVKPENIHEAICGSLAPSLTGQPGGYPTDPQTLDRFEALIEHTRLAGRVNDALRIYRDSFGDYEHLGLVVGDYIRGARIHSNFLSDPDGLMRSLGTTGYTFVHYERAMFAFDLGDLTIAERHLAIATGLNKQSREDHFVSTDLRQSSYLMLVRGRLPDALEHATDSLSYAQRAGDGSRVSISHFHLGYIEHLLGNAEAARKHFHDCRAAHGLFVAPRTGPFYIEWLIRTGRYSDARIHLDNYINGLVGYRADHNLARCFTLSGLLTLAIGGDARAAKVDLEKARQWVRRSGDVEVTLRSHLLACEIALRSQDYSGCLNEAGAALQLAEGCDYGLYTIDLFVMLARTHLAASDPASALRATGEAIARATRPDTRYAWAASDASQLEGEALLSVGKIDQALERFRSAVESRARIGHPRLSESRKSLAALEKLGADRGE